MKQHKWTDEEKTIVKARYNHTKASAQAIAIELRQNITACAVQHQASRLGATIPRPGVYKNWTPEEDERLISLSEKHCLSTIATTLKRSIPAIKTRMYAMHFSSRKRYWFNATDVCYILGMTHRTLQKHISSGRLKAKLNNGQHKQESSSQWHINREDLKIFIRTYPHELIAKNIDAPQIVDLLCGILKAKEENNENHS